MTDRDDEILKAICDIREMVRLLAEPAIAQRDKKLRDELRRIVGSSGRKRKAVLLMDGSRTQAEIQRQTEINQGDLSTLVKRLSGCKLLSGETKRPGLAIQIQPNFFETDSTDE